MSPENGVTNERGPFDRRRDCMKLRQRLRLCAFPVDLLLAIPRGACNGAAGEEVAVAREIKELLVR